MKDERKTKKQLIEELDGLRGEVADLREKGAGGVVPGVARQLAAERVRAETMAMHSTDDLLKVVVVLHQEITKLGVGELGCSISFMSEESSVILTFSTEISPLLPILFPSQIHPENSERVAFVFESPLNDPGWRESVGYWRRQEVEFHQEDLAIEDLSRGYMQRNEISASITADTPHISHHLGAQSIINVPFEHGVVGFRERSFHEDHIAIVQELTEALSLGYLRFLDFQKVEEQNRALVVEQALERVRTQVAAMQESQDLFNVSDVIKEELRGLGVPFHGVGVNIIDGAAQTWRQFSKVGTGVDRLIPHREVETARALWTHWKEGMTFTRHWDREDSIPWQQWNVEKGYVLEEDTGLASSPDEAYVVDVPFTHGTLAMNRPGSEPFSDEDIALLERFTEVFALGYRRYLDLKTAEEQAEQARRERAVERVRAEAMAMRSSDDLKNVVAVMFRELVRMEFPIKTVIICFMDPENESVTQACAFENPRKLGINFDANLLMEIDEDVVATEFRFGKEMFDSIMPDWQRTDVSYLKADAEDAEFLQSLNAQLGLHPMPPPIELDDYGQTGISFEHGVVGIRSRELNEEQIAIAKDFTSVLSLGYVRFLDFQKVDEAQRQLIDDLEEELQTAHDMQMSLMPTESPKIQGIDVAGQCLPANHVGGDTFQYFPRDGRLAISVADVTGHAMEAAIPVVMFSGILDNQMETAKPLEDLFSSLNRSLCRSLGKRTYVCFSMAEIEGHSLRLANCGCPYPLHFHAGEVLELRVEGYPLGVRPDTVYAAIEAQLAQGDYVVFVSDGIPEAVNADQEMFGDERTQATVRQGCNEDLSSEALIERLLAEVRSFCGEVAQEDDMTCVVVKVTG